MTMNSTISELPSTLNFVCDVDGVHTEIPIPSSAWDVENETVWLTQVQLEELYACSHANLVGHIGNIYDDEELQEGSTCRKFRQVQTEGNREVSREVKHYNLEMLIALGYRIRSKVATKFRQWATKHLKELMTKGQISDAHRYTVWNPDENDHHGSGAPVRQSFDMVLSNRSWRGSRIKQPQNVAPSP